MNAATRWQAIERGYGATILGGGRGKSSPLFSNFLEMIAKGDSEVLQAKKHIMNLISDKSNETFEELFNKWSKFYEELEFVRHKIANNDISKEEWIYTATLNINREFDLRNITFAHLLRIILRNLQMHPCLSAKICVQLSLIFSVFSASPPNKLAGRSAVKSFTHRNIF